MHSVGKGVTSMVVTVLMLALLVFTASRTLDLFQQVLPVSQSIFAYFGLAAIDGGVLGWSYFYAHGARGFQRSIALMMTGLSLIAVAVTTIGDLLIDAGNKGIITSVDEGTHLALLVAIGIVIVVNVTAGFLVHITEPERQKSIALEDAEAAIHAETLKQIRTATPQVAAQIAPELTADWVRQVAQSHLPGKTIRLAASTAIEAPQAINAKPVVSAPNTTPLQPAQAIPSDDKLSLTIQALTFDPNLSDTALADILDVKRPASARYWRLKAHEFLQSQGSRGIEPPWYSNAQMPAVRATAAQAGTNGDGHQARGGLQQSAN